MFKNQQLLFFVMAISVVMLFPSCSGIFGTKNKVSPTTGWEYNDPQNGGFEVASYQEQETGPGLMFVEGGTFVMGQHTEDPMYEYNNPPRRVTVRSFYMDETEVTNLDYLEYLYWLQRVFVSYSEVYRKALPDTLVWRERLAYNEPLSQLYLRHPAYHNYPVVGVNWVQANDYCQWRSDRVNEMLLIRQGILSQNPDQQDRDNFNTEAYLAGEYDGLVNRPLEDLSPGGTGERSVKLEDGILLPKYRLPTEAEWEYAAIGLMADYENIAQRNIYPWEGRMVRNTSNKRNYGEIMANFKRTRGDYMGVAGSLNDGADITAPVGTYPPNNFGLYNMAGNVAEWVQDVYRPMSHLDVSDYSPFRGNVFTKMKMEDGRPAEPDSLGRMRYEEVTADDVANRNNYRRADNRDYRDGDQLSVIDRQQWNLDYDEAQEADVKMYDYGRSSLVRNTARVVKGGSWKDGAHFLSPGTRRFLDEEKATDYIGFRCAMDRVGGPVKN